MAFTSLSANFYVQQNPDQTVLVVYTSDGLTPASSMSNWGYFESVNAEDFLNAVCSLNFADGPDNHAFGN